MNALIVTTDLLTIEPKEFVAQSYLPFIEALAAAIDRAPTLTYEIGTTQGMATAKEGRALFRDIRIALEKKRAAAKAPIIEIGRLLDSRAKEIAKEIEPFENRFDGDIKAEEERIAAAKEAAAKAEAERQSRIQALIDAIRNAPAAGALCNAAQLEEAMSLLRKTEITEAAFADRQDEATFVLKQSITQMGAMLEGKRAQEQLAAQQEAQRVENERLAAIAAKERADADAKQREEQQAAALKLKQEQDAFAKEKAEFEAQKAEAARLEAERVKMQAEEEAKAKAKVEAEARAKTAEEAKAAEVFDAAKVKAEAEAAPEQIACTPDDRLANAGKVIGKPSRPSHDELIQFVANHFNVSYGVACDWMIETVEHMKVAA